MTSTIFEILDPDPEWGEAAWVCHKCQSTGFPPWMPTACTDDECPRWQDTAAGEKA